DDPAARPHAPRPAAPLSALPHGVQSRAAPRSARPATAGDRLAPLAAPVPAPAAAPRVPRPPLGAPCLGRGHLPPQVAATLPLAGPETGLQREELLRLEAEGARVRDKAHQ